MRALKRPLSLPAAKPREAADELRTFSVLDEETGCETFDKLCVVAEYDGGKELAVCVMVAEAIEADLCSEVGAACPRTSRAGVDVVPWDRKRLSDPAF